MLKRMEILFFTCAGELIKLIVSKKTNYGELIIVCIYKYFILNYILVIFRIKMYYQTKLHICINYFLISVGSLVPIYIRFLFMIL